MQRVFFISFLMLVCHTATTQVWLTNFEEVKKIAKTENKHIILVFSGSDWCAPCIKLEKQILTANTFQEYARDHYVLIKADFPRKKKNQLPKSLQEQNKNLAEMYNRSGGFPLVTVLDKNGKKLGEVGYKKEPPESYVKRLNAFIK